MKKILLGTIIVMLFSSVGYCRSDGPGLDLAPGFFAKETPQFQRLSQYMQKADIFLSISSKDTISIPAQKQKDISFLTAKRSIQNIRNKKLALIMLEINCKDEAVHRQLLTLLKAAGFTEIIIVGADPNGIFLEQDIHN